jgi:hypothetical protein
MAPTIISIKPVGHELIELADGTEVDKDADGQIP